MVPMNQDQADPSSEVKYWKKCSSCKKEIPFEGKYQVCDVSTCNSKRTGLTFCSVACWDSHLGFARHRDASALEMKAPSKSQYLQSLTPSENQKPMTDTQVPRKIFVQTPKPSPSTEASAETLVVVSKIKQYIKDQSGFNTSQCCIDALTDKITRQCIDAIENAQLDGRKTVMGRDVR